AAADAFAASLDAVAAFSDAARACFATFLLLRAGVSAASGAAVGAGVAVAISATEGLAAGDAPPNKFENRLLPAPPAHPPRKIKASRKTTKCRIDGRSRRLSRAGYRWFGRR